jgi:RNA-directed DNA polymerase
MKSPQDRSEKAIKHNSDMHVPEQSDCVIVPWKGQNKAGKPAADALEGRAQAKENLKEETGPGLRDRLSPVHAIRRVREAARKNRSLRFNNLLHLITPSLLMRSFEGLNRKAAPGIDDVVWKEYEKDAYTRVSELHARIHRGSYRAQPSRRTYIRKEDGSPRAIGIAALEDKIVEQAVVTVLNGIYEEDFLGFSYGFRPGHSQHQALDALYVALTERKVSWIIDADIRGFFDHLDHDWLLKFVEHRVSDVRMLRLIAKWLKAGVMEEGRWSETELGTPQGGVISPLLANIYLHYALDLWVEQWRKKKARGEVYIVRYADDFVMGFQYKSDADQMMLDLPARLKRFGLELHQDKTRLIEFGRFAADNRLKRGEGKPETFNFLGFTHICARRRSDGRFTVWRKSMSKRIRRKLTELGDQLKRNCHDPVAKQGAHLRSVVRGWYNYHAVPTNMSALSRFRWEVGRLWFKALRRRSQKARRMTWATMSKLIKTWLPSPKILHPWPDQRFRQRRTLLSKARAV